MLFAHSLLHLNRNGIKSHNPPQSRLKWNGSRCKLTTMLLVVSGYELLRRLDEKLVSIDKLHRMARDIHALPVHPPFPEG